MARPTQPNPAEQAVGLAQSLDWGRLRDRSVVALTALAFAAALIWLGDRLFRILVMVMVAMIIAYVLEPGMKWAETAVPRTIAAIGVYVTAILIVAMVGIILGNLLLAEASMLATQLPIYVNRTADAAQTYLAFQGIGLPLGAGTATGQIQNAVQGGMKDLVSGALNAVTLVATTTVEVVITAVLAFYFMVDGSRIRGSLTGLVPRSHRDKVTFVEDAVDQVLGAYVRGQLILATTVGVLSGLGCWALGVRYPLVIGLLAFFLELIPMLGPILASLPAIVLALFQPFPLVVWVVIFFVVLQMVENHILAPRISGHAVGLHPVVALLALLIGAQAAGPWGALFAVPAAGIMSVLIAAVWRSWNGLPVIVQRGGVRLRLRRTRRTAA